MLIRNREKWANYRKSEIIVEKQLKKPKRYAEHQPGIPTINLRIIFATILKRWIDFRIVIWNLRKQKPNYQLIRGNPVPQIPYLGLPKRTEHANPANRIPFLGSTIILVQNPGHGIRFQTDWGRFGKRTIKLQ